MNYEVEEVRELYDLVSESMEAEEVIETFIDDMLDYYGEKIVTLAGIPLPQPEPFVFDYDDCSEGEFEDD